MKLLRLDILNLASLEGRWVIDFEEGLLGQSQIFSIVGPTGSGKSTLLDAICLPLYGRAPRYPRQQGQRGRIKVLGEESEGERNRLAPSDPRNILTRGKKQGYSHLTFLANDGHVYLAEWDVTFKTKAYGNAERHLYRLQQTADATLTRCETDIAELEQRIIGLDFDQFLRTVLIAQGTFATFLNATEDERYKLLEKLVGNGERYRRIAEQIVAGRDQAAEALNALRAQTDAFTSMLLSDERLAALQQTIAETEAHEQRIEQERKRIEEALRWYQEHDRRTAALTKAVSDSQRATAHHEALGPTQQRLQLHDATVEAVALWREEQQQDRLIADIARQQTMLANDTEAAKQKQTHLTQQMTTLQAQQEERAKALADAMPHIKTARELRAQLEPAVKAEKERQTKTKRAERDFTRQHRTLLATIMAETGDDAEAVSRLKDETDRSIAGIDAATVQRVHEEAVALLAACDEAIRIATELTKAREKADGTKQKLARLQTDEQRLADEAATLHVEELKTEVDTLRQTFTLMTSTDWQQHRRGLTEGEPCPLCGATHHPYAADEALQPAVNSLKELLDAKTTALNALQQHAADIARELATVRGQQKVVQQNLKHEADDVNRLTEQYAAICRRHAEWTAETTAPQQMRQHYTDRLEQAKGRLTAYNAARERSTALGLWLAWLTAKTEQDEAAAYRAGIEAKYRGELDGRDPDEVERQLSSATTEAAAAVERQRADIAAVELRLSGLAGKQTSLAEQLEQVKERRQSATKRLDEWIASAPTALAASRELLAALTAATEDWEALRRQVAESRERVASTKALLEQAQQAVQEHTASHPAEERDELVKAQQTVAQQSRYAELVELRATLNRHNDATQRLGALKTQLDTATQTYTDWEELYQSIGNRDGETLRKVVQCYTLRFLVAHANHELARFNTRYELVQVHNSLGLRVIDHDRANDIRDTTSLSGGETFIVSLGLALGLSALSSDGVAFGNLFIDEGFGTLDPDTLATVIDALSMLQTSQGKKVCVISHTDTMAERISTQIRVTKNGNTGTSRIDIVAG